MSKAEGKDRWDKLDIVAKGVLALCVSGAIGAYGIVSSGRAERARTDEATRAREDRRATTLIQLVNARESATTDLRSSMFSNLLQHYFRPASEASGAEDLSSTLEALESRIVVLQMIGLNFRDAIQVKPLFEQLDREIQALDRGSPEDREAIVSTRRLLRNAAEKIIVDQVKQIESASNGITCSVKLQPGEVSVPECLSYVGITLESVSKNRDFITLSVRDQTQEAAEPVEFDVSYFDMPMVDYTRMSDPPTTYSITLRDIPEDGPPRIFVAVLPTRSYRGSEAYRFEELLGEFIDPEITQ